MFQDSKHRALRRNHAARACGLATWMQAGSLCYFERQPHTRGASAR